MPDITMCINGTCRVRRDCFRWMAMPTEYQSYSRFNTEGRAECDHFMPIWEGGSRLDPDKQDIEQNYSKH